MRAGVYREHVEFVRKVRVDLPSGDFEMQDETLLSTFARVITKNPSVDTIANHRDVEQVFEFNIRHRSDIIVETSDNILWRGRRFVIGGIKWDYLFRDIVITAFAENESAGK